MIWVHGVLSGEPAVKKCAQLLQEFAWIWPLRWMSEILQRERHESESQALCANYFIPTVWVSDILPASGDWRFGGEMPDHAPYPGLACNTSPEMKRPSDSELSPQFSAAPFLCPKDIDAFLFEGSLVVRRA